MLAWLSSWNTATSKKKKSSFERSMEENLGHVLSIFRYLVSLYQKALDITDAEGDDVTNDIFVGAKAELENISG